MKFSVKVPASTSNLGPGFDTIGLALDLYNIYHFETLESKSQSELLFSTNIKNIDSVSTGKDNLTYRSFDFVFQKCNQKTPSIKIYFEAGVPLSGGFGSSSTAIAAGILAANKILGFPYSQEEILKLGTQLDGHPDNITPAIIGGFIVCVYANSDLNYIKLSWNQDLFFVVLIPDFKVPTSDARAALPSKINYMDAIYNVGFSSLLVAAVASQNTEILKKSFKDKLHQEYRASLVPGMSYVLDIGLESGAVGTMLSGAGSTLIAVVDNNKTAHLVGTAMQAAWLQYGIKSEFKFVKAIDHGAEIIENHLQ